MRRLGILLVDDDPNLLVLLADQLRADGYQIQTARDGVEALRRLRTSWPDLLIIDMMMPRMDGLTLAREIKARADLPIIVLSAIDAGDSKADLLEEVAEDYVTKPYHYPELRARINRVLRRLGDKVPRQSLVLGPELTLDLHRREATVGGERRPAHADRIAAALRAGRQPRPDRDDRDAPVARLGRDRGRRSVLRLGDDAAPPPEGRASTRTGRSTSRPSEASAIDSSRSTAIRMPDATPGRGRRRPTWPDRRSDPDRRPARRRSSGRAGARRAWPRRALARWPGSGRRGGAGRSGCGCRFRSRLTLGLVGRRGRCRWPGSGSSLIGRPTCQRPPAILGSRCCSRCVIAACSRILVAYLLAADLIGAAAGDRRRRRSRVAPATCRPRSRSRARTSWRAWPRATTGSPRPRAAEPRARQHPRRDRARLAARRRGCSSPAGRRPTPRRRSG